MIAGPAAPSHGEAKNSWLTGTAAWNFVAVTQWILGIRPTLDGLQIQPVLPTSWDGYRATRRYRGATYHIRVDRRGPGDEAATVVNGEPVTGPVVPPASGGDVHVEVVFG